MVHKKQAVAQDPLQPASQMAGFMNKTRRLCPFLRRDF
jgi:hypothetical protein